MKKNITLVALGFGVAVQAGAAITLLNFEGLQDGESIDTFYNGGTGSLGSVGLSYGITFGGQAIALIDVDAGGEGNFANEPSPSTVMYFPTASTAFMNVLAGFDTGFSFYYTSSEAASVTVYDDFAGTGNILATLALPGLPLGTAGGDPGGFFDIWSPVGVAFSGTAKSVAFSGVANQAAFDNITFGSETPVNDVPEANTYAAGVMVALAGGSLWLRRNKRA